MKMQIEVEADDFDGKIRKVEVWLKGENYFVSSSWNTDLHDRPKMREAIQGAINDMAANLANATLRGVV